MSARTKISSAGKAGGLIKALHAEIAAETACRDEVEARRKSAVPLREIEKKDTRQSAPPYIRDLDTRVTTTCKLCPKIERLVSEQTGLKTPKTRTIEPFDSKNPNLPYADDKYYHKKQAECHTKNRRLRNAMGTD